MTKKRAIERHERSKQPRDPKKGGRVTVLDDDKIKVLTDAARAGLPMWQCAHFAGCDTSAYTEWRQRGAMDLADGRPTTVFARLVLGLEKAKSDLIAASLLRIQQAGRGGALVEETTTSVKNADGTVTTTTKRKVAQPQWQADAWMAERSQPQDFGRTFQNVELTGKDGGPVAVDSWAGLAKLAESAKK